MCAYTTHRLTRRAMNCRLEAIAAGQDQDRLVAAAHEALDEVEKTESRLSRFIETSDIARINAGGAIEPVRVSRETIEVLQVARRICEMTDRDTGRHVAAFRLQNGAVGMSAQNEQNYSYRGQGFSLRCHTPWGL